MSPVRNDEDGYDQHCARFSRINPSRWDLGVQGLPRTAQGFPKLPHHCTWPAGKEDTPGCSASSSTRGGARMFHSRASKTCATASPWGVHLPDQLTVCRPHPCILLGEGSSRVMY